MTFNTESSLTLGTGAISSLGSLLPSLLSHDELRFWHNICTVAFSIFFSFYNIDYRLDLDSRRMCPHPLN
jgi:hypothetical protein